MEKANGGSFALTTDDPLPDQTPKKQMRRMYLYRSATAQQSAGVHH
jgi:hypothetical protein